MLYVCKSEIQQSVFVNKIFNHQTLSHHYTKLFYSLGIKLCVFFQYLYEKYLE